MHHIEIICLEQGSQLLHFYAPAYSKNSQRALSVTPVRPVCLSVCLSVRPSVRPYVPLSCPGHNSKTLWNIFMKLHRCIHHNKTMCHEQGRQLLHFYAPAYSKNSGRALSVIPVRPVRPSVRPYVPLSCPGHNSKTLWNIFMKLHRCIHHNKTMCHEQGRQLLLFWFLNYFPLT